MLCYEFPVCLGFLAARQSTSSKLGDLVLILSLTRKHILNAFSEPGWYTCFAHILSLNLQQSWEAGDIVSIFYDDKALSLCEGGGARLSDFLGLNELSLSITLWIQIVVHRMYLNLRPILWDPVPPLPGYASRFLLFIQFGALFFFFFRHCPASVQADSLLSEPPGKPRTEGLEKHIYGVGRWGMDTGFSGAVFLRVWPWVLYAAGAFLDGLYMNPRVKVFLRQQTQAHRFSFCYTTRTIYKYSLKIRVTKTWFT